MGDISLLDNSMSRKLCSVLLHPLLIIFTLISLFSFLGWTGEITEWQHYTTLGAAFLFLAQRGFVFFLEIRKKENELRRIRIHLIAGFIAFLIASVLLYLDFTENQYREGLWHSLIQILILFSGLTSLIHHQTRFTAKAFHPGLLLAGSFLGLIIIGTFLLKMPRCVNEGETISWLDSMFTSTSAICVTGLAVQNTATFFSPTGQVILLILIQVGGLGIMTLTFFAAALLFEGISLHDRLLLGKMIQESRLSRLNQTLAFIILLTFSCEFLGALFLFLSSPSHLPLDERAFHSLFHSISAFCNAGFSTFPDGIASQEIAGNHTWQATLMLLIIIGGIGVFVAEDLMQWLRASFLRRISRGNQQRFKLRIHTRLVVWVTFLLVIIGALLIFVSEFILGDGPDNGGKIFTSLFHSVTTRTAGFNSVSMSSIHLLTAQIMIILMFIGGSPGGTAGGVRTTVIALALKQIWNQIRNSRRGLTVFHRKISPEIGTQALGLFLLSIFWIILNFIILRAIEPDPTISDTRLFFELVSAFATVGLSLDLTHLLSDSSKVLLIINMFVGRIGLFTLLATLITSDRRHPSGKPTETIHL